VDIYTFWRLGFRQSSFRHITRAFPAHRPIRLGTAAGFLACYFPSAALSDRGKPLDPEIFLHIPPYSIGDTTERLAAQSSSTTKKARRYVLPRFASDASFNQLTGVPCILGHLLLGTGVEVSRGVCRSPVVFAFDA
jgi:hypothetical protein